MPLPPHHRTIAKGKVGSRIAEKAHRPRAVPLTTGLSGNVGSATSTLSYSTGEHDTAGLSTKTLSPLKYK